MTSRLWVVVVVVFVIIVVVLVTINQVTINQRKTTQWVGRAYYLTRQRVPGDTAKAACAQGFHMASHFEISETSTLTYRADLGYTTEDSGSGPPSDGFPPEPTNAPSPHVTRPLQEGSNGWVRTGSIRSDMPPLAGMPQANCRAWTSSSKSDNGTVISPAWKKGQSSYPYGIGSEIGNWNFLQFTCDTQARVWCVQD